MVYVSAQSWGHGGHKQDIINSYNLFSFQPFKIWENKLLSIIKFMKILDQPAKQKTKPQDFITLWENDYISLQ